MAILLTLRFHLSRENRRRDLEPIDDQYNNVYIERTKDGVVEKIKVDKVT